ncbi:hypothetical protein GCWU000342_00982 [Shuttleworthella satelles DSM 14600]|uniref:Uncharacterized protein n=1 Tax=Shuttleworthella satelles DSM 14600 TaxID=626523 RepID=C4GAN1_9FIRM|nr:hypothetical protein GCWU000342_00982 [Shuttleworthia satelles DSM 14600]
MEKIPSPFSIGRKDQSNQSNLSKEKMEFALSIQPFQFEQKVERKAYKYPINGAHERLSLDHPKEEGKAGRLRCYGRSCRDRRTE